MWKLVYYNWLTHWISFINNWGCWRTRFLLIPKIIDCKQWCIGMWSKYGYQTKKPKDYLQKHVNKHAMADKTWIRRERESNIMCPKQDGQMSKPNLIVLKKLIRSKNLSRFNDFYYIYTYGLNYISHAIHLFAIRWNLAQHI